MTVSVVLNWILSLLNLKKLIKSCQFKIQLLEWFKWDHLSLLKSAVLNDIDHMHGSEYCLCMECNFNCSLRNIQCHETTVKLTDILACGLDYLSFSQLSLNGYFEEYLRVCR